MLLVKINSTNYKRDFYWSRRSRAVHTVFTMTGKMIVLLLLVSFFTKGFSYEEAEYGDTYSTWLQRKTKSIEFMGVNSPDVTIVWKQNGPAVSPRHKVVRSYFKIEKVTRRDSGTYTMKDKDQIVLSTKTLAVTEKQRYNSKDYGDYFDFTFDLEPASCNIYFIPDHGYEIMDRSQIVREGRLVGYENSNCKALKFLHPCGLSRNFLQSSCSGRFEIRDQHNDLALVESLEVAPEDEFHAVSFINIGIGISIILISFCCYIMRCVYQKNPSRKDMSQSPDGAPTTHQHQYDNEPVGPRPEQLSRPSQTLHPTVPSYNPSVPLIHNPPSVSLPPAYSEIHNPPSVSLPPAYSEIHNPPFGSLPPAYSELAGPSYPAAPASKPSSEPMNPSEPAASSSEPPAAPLQDHGDAPAPTFGSDCLSSDPELTYELRGLTAPSLSSDLADVYTSDKLNF